MKQFTPRVAAALAMALAASPLLWAQDDAMTDPAPAEAPQADADFQQRQQARQQQDADAVARARADAAAQGDEAVALDTEVQRLSYALGYMIGSEYGRNEIELDPGVFSRGLASGLSGEEGHMSREQLQMTLMNFQRRMQARQMQRIQEQAQRGEEFLAQNKAKPNVRTTESGLQYEVIEEGEGESPSATDTVRVHYRGSLTDGSEFDSSYDGEPAVFPVNGVIPGWTEALQMMKPGAKYKLVIPADLAYGASGRPPVIPPNSVLVFEVELLEVVE